MVLYQRITKLADDVDMECVTSEGEGGQEFLPYNKLDELVTIDKVSSAFQDANISGAEDLLGFVLNDAKRLFLILVRMTSRTVEKLSLLRDLQRDGINDASLPIGFKRDNNKYYGYSLEDGLDGTKFEIFNNWERNDRELFESNQWRFTAPVFDGSRFRFNFTKKRILPYLEVAPKPASSGFFGEVSRIVIHSAHIPVLRAVSNLSLLFSLRLSSNLLGSSHR